jgi:DNA-directed RNA polymerase subunit RPC12/RpoP
MRARRGNNLERALREVAPRRAKLPLNSQNSITSESPLTQPVQGAPQQALQFQCPQCGGEMAFDVAAAGLKCKYCKHQMPVPVPPGAAGAREIPLREGYQRAPKGLGVTTTSFNCKECGATVNLAPNERTASCTYCASHSVVQVPSDPNLIQPETVIPFRVAKDKAVESFKSWLAGLWFRPSNLKTMAQLEQVFGVYVPYWTFDANVYSQWHAERGWYYYVTETYTEIENGESVTKTREVRHTRWEPAHGQRQDHYDDVLVCASKGLPEELSNSFATFDTGHLVAYAPGYLAGWRAESYAIDLPAAWTKAQVTIQSGQQSKCHGDVGGDEVRSLVVQNQYSNETFKPVLLPVYVAAYRYNNKPFRFLVNGQTGEVRGEAPYSWVKITLAVLAVVAVIVALVLIFGGNGEGDSARLLLEHSVGAAQLPRAAG